VREVDNRQIGAGKPGEICRFAQDSYFKVVHGQDPTYGHWLTYV
jgi:branched-chain amino acid aminotransferase